MNNEFLRPRENKCKWFNIMEVSIYTKGKEVQIFELKQLHESIH